MPDAEVFRYTIAHCTGGFSILRETIHLRTSCAQNAPHGPLLKYNQACISTSSGRPQEYSESVARTTRRAHQTQKARQHRDTVTSHQFALCSQFTQSTGPSPGFTCNAVSARRAFNFAQRISYLHA